MKHDSQCCYASIYEGNCTWCGKPAEKIRERDELWHELEMLLCDWNAPSRLESLDLNENLARVWRFIRKRDLKDHE